MNYLIEEGPTRDLVVQLRRDNAELNYQVHKLKERQKELEHKQKQAVVEFKDKNEAHGFLEALAFCFNKSIRENEENILVFNYNEFFPNCFLDSLWVELRLVDGKYKMIFRNK